MGSQNRAYELIQIIGVCHEVVKSEAEHYASKEAIPLNRNE